MLKTFSWRRLLVTIVLVVLGVGVGVGWYISRLTTEVYQPSAIEICELAERIQGLIEKQQFEDAADAIRENPHLVVFHSQGRQNSTIIRMVVATGRKDLFEALLDVGVDETLLSANEAIRANNLVVMRYLLERGFDPNRSIDTGYIGDRHENFDLIHLYLDFGLDPEHHGRLVAVSASTEPNEMVLPLMERLLEAGASPNVGNKERTPLVAAIFSVDRQRFDLLMKYGADIHYNNLQLMPLVLNAFSRSPDDPDHLLIFRTLLERGAAIDVPSHMRGKSVREFIMQSAVLRAEFNSFNRGDVLQHDVK